LTTDDDDEVGRHDQVKGECPSPGPGESVSPPHNAVGALQKPDLAFEDYLSQDPSPLNYGNWTAWNWSHLKAQVWVVTSCPDGADDDGCFYDDVTDNTLEDPGGTYHCDNLPS